MSVKREEHPRQRKQQGKGLKPGEACEAQTERPVDASADGTDGQASRARLGAAL